MTTYSASLKQHPADPCLYYVNTPEVKVYIAVHTDDYLVATNCESWYRKFYAAYNALYPSTDQGQVTKFLGINVDYNVKEHRLTLSQEGEIHELLQKFGLKEAHSKPSPMVLGTLLPSDTEIDPSLSYRQLTGALLWIARNTRPDILYAVQYHAQFSNCSTAQHFTSLKRVLLYLKGTASWKIIYTKSDGQRKVELYSDTDWAANKLDRRSWSGSAITVDGNLIGWWCRKQQVVALSSMEAEYMGMCSASRNGMYIVHLLYHVAKTYLPIPLYCDNRAAEIFSSKAMINERTKHIDIAYHYVRQKIAQGFFKPIHINTDVNLADLFTKALTSDRTQWLGQALLGMRVISMAIYNKFGYK